MSEESQDKAQETTENQVDQEQSSFQDEVDKIFGTTAEDQLVPS